MAYLRPIGFVFAAPLLRNLLASPLSPAFEAVGHRGTERVISSVAAAGFGLTNGCRVERRSPLVEASTYEFPTAIPGDRWTPLHNSILPILRDILALNVLGLWCQFTPASDVGQALAYGRTFAVAAPCELFEFRHR